MKFEYRHVLASFAALALAISATPATAATNPVVSAVDESFQVPGLIVSYRDGVAPVADNGQPTGENAAGIDLLNTEALGLGFYAVQFESELSNDLAIEVARRMSQDPRIETVEIDAPVVAASGLPRVVTALRAASAPRYPVAKDAFSALAPSNARVNLSWAAPSSTYGAKIAGYRIERSVNGSSWAIAVSNTARTGRSYTVTTGNTPGVNYYWRVRAITKLGSAVRVGLASAAVRGRATTVAQPPQLISSDLVKIATADAAAGTTVTWASQSIYQKGGLRTSYRATALLNGTSAGECITFSNSCSILGLAPEVEYEIKVAATNARGTSYSGVTLSPSDPEFSKQWYLGANNGINAAKAWSMTTGSRSVVVAVLDSGITNHPDLEGNIVSGYDFVECDSNSGSCELTNDGDGPDADPTDPGDYLNSERSSWHGTHVAGIIAARANDIGIVGVAPQVRIQPVRVLGAGGSGNSSSLVKALNWASGIPVSGVPANSTPAKVINLSVASPEPGACPASLATVLPTIKARGITVVTAAGNSAGNAANYWPGNCYPTINVGSVAPSGEKATYSNYGSQFSNGVDIAAPGGDSQNPAGSPSGTNGRILSLINNGNTVQTDFGYSYQEGTSMAAPMVTGVVALMYSVKANITPDQIWNILQTTAKAHTPNTQCSAGLCGIGVINASLAVAAAAALP